MRKLRRVIMGVVAVFGCTGAYIFYPAQKPPGLIFPDGKKFAFTIVDDTDMTTLERSKPLYEILERNGLRTTKTVWVLESNRTNYPPNRGATLQDPAYRDYIVGLQNRGFEIALHGVRGGDSTRQDIIRGLDEFRAVLGQYPKIHVNHSLNRDNVYWGSTRWSFAPYRWAYQLLTRDRFSGEDTTSDYFWGDLLQERVRYVNQFTFLETNLLNVVPNLPYHLTDKPYVNYWFPTSDGDNLERFEALLAPENLDRLEREGGLCIVYTHLGSGSFNEDGAPHPTFEARIKDVASRNGWFVPASRLLDYMMTQPGWKPEPTLREKIRLESVFLWALVRRGVELRMQGPAKGEPKVDPTKRGTVRSWRPGGPRQMLA